MTITRKVDVIIKQGEEVIFEKKGFEVPEKWSDRAATICASKYATSDEYSAVTIIDRIVNTITEWGKKNGYFDSEDEVNNFNIHLKGILINQRAAFNSPVWFNIGSDTSTNQGSACFIVPVDDNMESILEHNTTEGLIFRGGSGVGTNVSKLRHKGAPLSNKGSASGPLSFMRMWDATAGIIRSGGKTRRSAKMVCMDIDHPDIMDFIDCKKIEEDKAKILIANGVDAEEAYATVSFQNTNHSIVATDDFMQKVRNKQIYNLKNGEIINAKDVLKRTAEIAWETGDPGIIFRDRVNIDNPVPQLGDIDSPNPCFTGDTVIYTPNGLIPIKELYEESVKTGRMPSVYTKDSVVSNPIAYMCTGMNDIYVVTLSDGREVKCTENHNWYIEGKKIQTKDLKLNMPVELFPGVKVFSEDPEDEDFNEFGFPKKGLTDISNHLSKLFTDNVFISENSYLLDYKSKSKKELLDIQMLLDIFGIRSSVGFSSDPRDNYFHLYVDDKGSLEIFKEHVKFSSDNYNKKLDNIIDKLDDWKDRNPVIVDIDKQKEQEVTYNLTEPINNLVYANGVLIAQCSEFFAVDNSSCNLSSMNLMKYLNDKQDFDFNNFKEDIKVMITAMDIIVGSADYPTKEIERITKMTRPLGLGFSNLGATLMVMGMPYDSEQAREFAKNVTKNMTTFAYNTSIDLAKRLGSFTEYKRSDKAKEAVYGIAKRLTDDVTANRVKEHGIRNSQLTLLAPCGTIGLIMDCDSTGIEPLFALKQLKTLAGGGSLLIEPKCVQYAQNKSYDKGVLKTANEIHWKDHIRMMAACQPHLNGAISKCVTGDTLIPTEKGIVEIGDLYSGETEDTFSDINLKVASESDPQVANYFYYGGERSTVKVTLSDGRTIEGTPNHRIKAVKEDGSFDWVRLDEIVEGQFVGVKIGGDVWAKNYERVKFSYFDSNNIYNREIDCSIKVDENVGWIIGAFIALGNVCDNGDCIDFRTDKFKNYYLYDIIKDYLRETFSLEGYFHVNGTGRLPTLRYRSASLCEFMRCIGVNGNGFNAKEIPKVIMGSPKKVIQNFIKGLWLRGSFESRNRYRTEYISYRNDHSKFKKQLQSLLDNFGIESYIIDADDRYSGSIRVRYPGIGKFVKLFGHFHRTDIQKSIKLPLKTNKEDKDECMTSGKFPCYLKDIEDNIKRRGVPTTHPSIVSFYQTYMVRGLVPTYNSVLNAVNGHIYSLPDPVKSVFENGITFSEVVSIEQSIAKVYDFHVPANNTFIGNGIINHNTVNMSADSKVEDIRQSYIYAWKKGLKCIAVYRDGSKSLQPLTEVKKDPEPVKVELRKTDNRVRLKDTREAIAHKLDIGGYEAYLHAGKYENGDVGELFIKMAKEGTLVSGVMDSFATIVSLGLQYGVPLEKIVDKMKGTKFDPCGITANPKIPLTTSIMDYIARWLELTFIKQEEEKATKEMTGSICPDCGGMMFRSGTCDYCSVCGTSSGCS
jgi:ribonucleotide reductase alpha subunit